MRLTTNQLKTQAELDAQKRKAELDARCPLAGDKRTRVAAIERMFTTLPRSSTSAA